MIILVMIWCLFNTFCRLGRSRRRAVSGPSRRAIKGYYDTITPQPPNNSSATKHTFKHQNNHVSQGYFLFAYVTVPRIDSSPQLVSNIWWMPKSARKKLLKDEVLKGSTVLLHLPNLISPILGLEFQGTWVKVCQANATLNNKFVSYTNCNISA